MPVFENFPYTNFHNLNLDWILEKVKSYETQLQALVENIENVKKTYETVSSITNLRKLSENGDFTGSIQGTNSLSILEKINGSESAIQYLASQFSQGCTGQVVNGAFFDDSGINKNYNGGKF